MLFFLLFCTGQQHIILEKYKRKELAFKDITIPFF
jgi:hypothetical protein